MNLSDITLPKRIYQEQWFSGPKDLEQLAIFKVMDGIFKDPLASSDEDIEDDPSKRKTGLNNLLALMSGPKTIGRMSMLDERTHNFFIKTVAKCMTSLPHTKYFPSPACSNRLDDTSFEPDMELVEKERKCHLDWMSIQWEKNIRAQVNIALGNASDMLKAHSTDTVMNRLANSYKMVAEIVTDLNDKATLTHKEHLQTMGSASLVDLRNINKIVKLSIEDQSLCSIHGISFPPAEFLSDMTECRKLCFNHKVLFACTESALNALLNDKHAFMIPVTVNKTDNGNFICIENTLDNNNKSTYASAQKYYKFLLLKALSCKKKLGKTDVANDNAKEILPEPSNRLEASQHRNNMEESVLDLNDDSSEDDEKLMMVDDMPQNNTSEKNKISSYGTLSEPQHKQEKLSVTSTNNVKQNLTNNLNSTKKCTCPDITFKFEKFQLSPQTVGMFNKDPISIILRSENYLSSISEDPIAATVLLEKWPTVGSMKFDNHGLPPEQTLTPQCHLAAHVDARNGNVLMFRLDEINQTDEGDPRESVRAYSIFKTLQRLNSGDYLLWHQPSHGASVLLYSATYNTQAEAVTIQQLMSKTPMTETHSVPTLNTDVMLPWQWQNGQAPLMFPIKSLQVRAQRRGVKQRQRKRRNRRLQIMRDAV